MATPEQRARRRAQRENAARLKGKEGKYTPVIPRSTRAAVRAGREAYARDVIAGREPYPPDRSPEAKNLASLAGKARWGKADPIYERAFSRYWYHKNDDKNDADVEDNADYQADDNSGDDDEDNDEN